MFSRANCISWILLLATVSCGVHSAATSAPAGEARVVTPSPEPEFSDAGEFPNTALTPGAVVSVDVATVCSPGYASSQRPRGTYWRRLRDKTYSSYRIPRGERSYLDSGGRRHLKYVIDHLIPLELGGAPDDLRNLWPEPILLSKRKDAVENELHWLVCNGRMTLVDAQRSIARNWEAAVSNAY